MAYYRQKGLIERDAAALRSGRHGRPPTRRCAFPASCWPTKRPSGYLSPIAITTASSSPRLDGKLVERSAPAQLGAADGDFANATFNHPQGMALAGDTLYVADTENHMLRKIDLKSDTSHPRRHRQAGQRLAGHRTGRWSGSQRQAPTSSASRARRRSTALGICGIDGNDLYIAMAGSHQIWKMPLDEMESAPTPATAAKTSSMARCCRGSLTKPGFASFAQPSGLASDGTWLFVADSEGSSIRAVPFDARQTCAP